jgi:hypothetical protein
MGAGDRGAVRFGSDPPPAARHLVRGSGEPSDIGHTVSFSARYTLLEGPI